VNLIGEHTDYNGGPALPVAVERRTAVAAGPRDDWRFVSSVDGVGDEVDPDAPLRRDWTDYLVGTVRVLRQRGAAPAGARVAAATSVPIGAGLSLSAALTVAATRALGLLAGRSLPPADLVQVTFHAERGTALLFEAGIGTFRAVPFEGRLWIVEAGVSHRLTGGDLASAGGLPVEAHLSLGDDYRPTVPEADFIVERAMAHRAHGARLTGAGWGGAVVLLAPAHRQTRIAAEVCLDFGDQCGRVPGAWSTLASAGVRREALPTLAG
jgi:galactokinase